MEEGVEDLGSCMEPQGHWASWFPYYHKQRFLSKTSFPHIQGRSDRLKGKPFLALHNQLVLRLMHLHVGLLTKCVYTQTHYLHH